MEKRWKILQPDIQAVRKLGKILHCNPIIAAILVNRNFVTSDAARGFLNSSLQDIRPPFSIQDMDAAVRRIDTAIQKNEKILIFGDYDVDGITATALLCEFLSCTGADVSYYIPHRTREGYGLQVEHVSDYAMPEGIHLIITADCGSGSHDAVNEAHRIGIDVIITDHHKISAKRPQAVAVLNPNRPDCTAGFEALAGVGVAFYLLICLRKHLRDRQFWRDRPEPKLKPLIDLVALGTVADMVPLVDENRILTKTGLQVINSGNRPGISALIKASGIQNNVVSAEDIAFRLAPRLNAAGRIAHAGVAVELLTTKNLETAGQIAASLDVLNSKRRETERNIFDQIQLNLKENSRLLEKCTLVLSDPGWHAGILGIVAARLVDRFYRPVVLISTMDGVGKGSARSIAGVDLYEGLSNCTQDLENFGGHSMAAGLTIKTENIPQFQRNFETAVHSIIRTRDLKPLVRIDYELDFSDLTANLTDDLESLHPFGSGNPEPLFMARDIKVLSSKIVGQHHRRMRLSQPDGNSSRAFNAIQFNIDTRQPLKDYYDKIAFKLQWNRWNRKKTIQLIIEAT